MYIGLFGWSAHVAGGFTTQPVTWLRRCRDDTRQPRARNHDYIRINPSCPCSYGISSDDRPLYCTCCCAAVEVSVLFLANLQILPYLHVKTRWLELAGFFSFPGIIIIFYVVAGIRKHQLQIVFETNASVHRRQLYIQNFFCTNLCTRGLERT